MNNPLCRPMGCTDQCRSSDDYEHLDFNIADLAQSAEFYTELRGDSRPKFLELCTPLLSGTVYLRMPPRPAVY